ncbi:DUF4783 domain-containing protein [Lunatimonas lonarensis]|nr:DUF4783 domain-containing protein [Lunatimonas lonarensis]
MPPMRCSVFIFIGLITFYSYAQTPTTNEQNPFFRQIQLAFTQGSSKEIAKFMGTTIEIKLNEDRGNFSKNQAEIILRDFFKKNPPKNFEVIHQSESTEKISYLIGNYQSTDGIFKTLIKSKPGPTNQLQIYSLEITRE